MQKFDYKKELKHLYKPSVKNIETIDVPKMNFLMVDGHGDPNKEKSFEEAITVLYSVSYTLKFMIKKGEVEIPHGQVLDYVVRPLEGLWWAEDMMDFDKGNKDNWSWTLMIAQPDVADSEMVATAINKAKSKKPLLEFEKLNFKDFTEGRSAQIMYMGPYSDEGPTIKKIHHYIKEQNGSLSGKHHEIYLSDLRRTAPEKLKTIIRQPFQESP
ncbi:MAG: hypothetical protein D8M58_09265 [Calditrichaeota bacterium]|nr:MAG: hypothetical protein DWQ03_17225 [Calditrichota bacterium]MBL1205575.1 hypothetical protein [Calditrichota bacterium]NOG45404.1 hypothetical protein [Calditrichota bacterium]